jgi:LPS export ABC transporter protein LptC
MTALALFSVVLVKQNPLSASNTEIQKNSNSDHDYFLDSFSSSRYNKIGALDAYIKGGAATHFEKSEELAIENISFHLNKTGLVYLGSAGRALISDDADSIQFYEKVNVQRFAGNTKTQNTIFQSEYFKITANPDLFSSHLPVKISNGNKQIAANSLRYDNDQKMIHLSGSVSIKNSTTR